MRGMPEAVEATEALLRNRTEKRAAIQAAVAQAEEGAFFSQDAMNAWVSSWGSDSELPAPAPDVFPVPKWSTT